MKYTIENVSIMVCNLQIVREARTGDLVGEIGVLCYRPQPFTVRTKKLCQLLRLNRTTFLSIIQSNVGDGTIIMNNLLQVKHEFSPSFSVFFSPCHELIICYGCPNLLNIALPNGRRNYFILF